MTNKKSLKYLDIRRVFSTEEDEEENYDSEDVPLKPKANDTETEDSDSDKVKGLYTRSIAPATVYTCLGSIWAIGLFFVVVAS